MLLAVDIGNSQVTFGAFEGEALQGAWRIRTDATRTADEHGALLSTMMTLGGCEPADVTAVLVGSVVPQLNSAFDQACGKYFGVAPRFVTSELDTGVVLDVDRPHEVGADRIINAVAGLERYGAPVIIVDFGTATTFDVVVDDRRYVGGAILPGIQASMEALFERAALLSRVELRKPPALIGQNTERMVQSGFYYGFLGQMEGILTRMIAELGGTVHVVATGGLAGRIAGESELVNVVEPDLTLIGLQILHARVV